MMMDFAQTMFMAEAAVSLYNAIIPLKNTPSKKRESSFTSLLFFRKLL